MINIFEVNETNKMIEQENLDVRTITMGISLLDCIDSDLAVLNEKIYKKITIVQLKGRVKTIELKLENEIDRKISALFDSRMDELRYRKENKETREKVFELDMRVDNLEKAIMPA